MVSHNSFINNKFRESQTHMSSSDIIKVSVVSLKIVPVLCFYKHTLNFAIKCISKTDCF